MEQFDLKNPPSSISSVVYFGTPEIAVEPLKRLVNAGFNVPLVITRPDVRRGRGKQTSANPVKLAAQELGLKVSYELEAATEVEADLGVVVAYGRIIPVEVLQKLALVNLHFSALPKWRGAAPLERALIEGDETTAVCLMAIEEGLDTGGIYNKVDVVIDPAWNLADLASKCVSVGAEMLVSDLRQGLSEPTPQDGEPTYASMLKNEEFQITHESLAADVYRKLKVRPCWMMLDGKRIKVHSGTIGNSSTSIVAGEIVDTTLGLRDASLILDSVQPEGKKPMSANDWAQGRQNSSVTLDSVG